MSSIGDRVLRSLEQACPGVRHRDIADRIGMTADALSRALSGQRRFASIELAQLSEMTGSDLYWLITGQPDPHRLSIAARHDFDHATGRRSIPGRESDEQTLADIALAYRQAYPEPEQTSGRAWPKTLKATREVLGPDFVRPFVRRLEQRLGIDVVRVPEISTAYSFTVGGRPVIVIPATSSWFYENWSLAHELDHLIEGHHDDRISESEANTREAAANAFAAELLLPAETIKAADWDSTDEEDLACLVWNWGVSTDALCWRLKTVTGDVPAIVAQWSGQPTQRLLRLNLPADSERDEIAFRMDQSAQRRFPLTLQKAHLERVASGASSRATLAWMLGIDADALEVDSPEISEVDAENLAAALGL
jgi:Zn-dependent peptidase ImmA (M78 family)